MVTSFAPLALRSNYTLLSGTAPVEVLIERAQEVKLKALALTDTNNLYGAIPFYKLCKEAGIKPVIGTEIVHGATRAILLAKDYAGYSTLCRVITRRNLDEVFDLCNCLKEFHDCVYILTEDTALARALAAEVDKETLCLMLAHPGRSLTKWRDIEKCAGELGIATVATPDVYFLASTDYLVHQTLCAIRGNTLLSRLKPEDVAHPASYFPSMGEVKRVFREYPEALENSMKIVRACNCDIPLGRPVFPRYALPDGKTASAMLKSLCYERIPLRYTRLTEKVRKRLHHELAVIDTLGFSDYFLFVWDILKFARAHGISTVGRGSGASSLVAYLLGITNVNPIRFNIPFERFLHVKRRDLPDLDIDLCWVKRDELIENIYKEYGASRVAMVSVHSTFRLRSAFREAAKAFGVSNDHVNRMSKRLPYDSDRSLEEVIRNGPAGACIPLNEKPFDMIAAVAEQIRNHPRNIGIHCGGLVITDKPLDMYVPLERSAKGIVVTQYEKDAIEEIGLVKMDFLGNHALTIRDETVKLIRQRRKEEIDIEKIDERDAQTASLLQNGKTLSCCQLESPAMRNLLQMLQASSTEDVMQALALVRPGPAGMGTKETFVRRARKLEPVVYAHPLIKKVLGDSYGIMLYEDDGITMASAVAGLSAEEGDLVRRSIAKERSPEKLRKIADFFIRKAKSNGVPQLVAHNIWKRMEKFRSYSFCKAHAAGYGILAYQTAYLKAHYPLEFIVEVLNHHWGMYSKRIHLEEAKRLGLEVLLPSVNASTEAFTIEDGKIRIGLSQVKGLKTNVIEHILAERRKQRFDSLGDFLGRVRISEAEAESLILAGAFDFTGRIRPEMLWELKSTYKAHRRSSATNQLFSSGGDVLPAPKLKDYTALQKLEHELAVLELSVTGHPIMFVRRALRKRGFIESACLPGFVGKKVLVAGTLAALRRTRTKNRDVMEFVTLEDETGLFEVTLFPQVYKKYGGLFDVYGPYIVEGIVDEQYGAVTVNARKAALLDVKRCLPAGDTVPSRAAAR